MALMDGGTRGALATNERARHEPESSREYAWLNHPVGCSWCSTARRAATVTRAVGQKAFPSMRPWMVSHWKTWPRNGRPSAAPENCPC